MPVARLGGGNNFALYWLNLVILINHWIFVEIQVENYGSGVDLKIVLAWFLALSCQFSNLVSILHFKGNVYLYIHLFEP